MEALLSHLLRASLMVSVLIAAICLVRRFFRRQLGSRMVYALWLLVAIRLLLPLSIPVETAMPQVLREPLTAVLGQGEAPQYVAPDVPEGGAAGDDLLVAGAPSVTQPRSINVPLLLTVIWATGALGAAGFMVTKNIRFRRGLLARPVPAEVWMVAERTLRRLDRRIPRVLTCEGIDSPCLYGALRPAILLPAGIQVEGLSYALLHEECHRQAGDTRWALLRNALCCLFWFHPLVWMAARLHRVDAELACDARVMAGLTRAQRFPYAQALVRAAEQSAGDGAVLTTGVAFSGARLKDRVQLIMEEGNVKKSILVVTALLLVALLSVSFATPAGSDDPVWKKLETLNAELLEKELEQGRFETWTPEEQTEWQQKAIALGYEPARIVYGVPDAEAISRDDAVKQALMLFPSDFGPEGDMIGVAYNVIDADKPVWEIDLSVSVAGGFHNHNVARIDARTGEVVEQGALATWGEELTSDIPYDEARMTQIMNEIETRENAVGPMRRWTHEEKYEIQQERIAAGQPMSPYNALGLPEENHIPLANAIDVAIKAMEAKYGRIPDGEEETYSILSQFYEINVDSQFYTMEPFWEIELEPKDTASQHHLNWCRARVDAETGRVILIYNGEEGLG